MNSKRYQDDLMEVFVPLLLHGTEFLERSFVVWCAKFSALAHIVFAFISDPPLYSYAVPHCTYANE